MGPQDQNQGLLQGSDPLNQEEGSPQPGHSLAMYVHRCACTLGASLLGSPLLDGTIAFTKDEP
jgi:hypothetical protein